MADTRLQVQSALKALASKNTKEAATELFRVLGYASRKSVDLDGAPSSFLSFVDRDGRLAAKKEVQVDKWRRVDFLFQLTNDEIPILAQGNRDLFASQQDYRTSIIEDSSSSSPSSLPMRSGAAAPLRVSPARSTGFSRCRC